MKKCKFCDKKYKKHYNCSEKDWKNRKYCSKECSGKAKIRQRQSLKTEFKKGQVSPMKGRKRLDIIGKYNPNWKGGNITLTCLICKKVYTVRPYRKEISHFCSVNCQNIYKRMDENRERTRTIQRNRVKDGQHNLYRGRTELKEKIKKMGEYKKWRKAVFERDNYKCVLCKKTGELHPHHIEAFADILDKENIETIDDAYCSELLWDVKNGRTLCVSCHKQTDSYGTKKLKLKI